MGRVWGVAFGVITGFTGPEVYGSGVKDVTAS